MRSWGVRSGATRSCLLPGGRILSKKFFCPSAPGEVGAILLGVVQRDSLVAFIKDRIPVTRQFLDSVSDSVVSSRFRFSSPCIGSACRQWSRAQCGLPEALKEVAPLASSFDTPLPRCSIRAECRWFQQEGTGACRVCPIVITRERAPRESFQEDL